MDESQLSVLIAEGESEQLDFKRELRLDTAALRPSSSRMCYHLRTQPLALATS